MVCDGEAGAAPMRSGMGFESLDEVISKLPLPDTCGGCGMWRRRAFQSAEHGTLHALRSATAILKKNPMMVLSLHLVLWPMCRRHLTWTMAPTKAVASGMVQQQRDFPRLSTTG